MRAPFWTNFDSGYGSGQTYSILTRISLFKEDRSLTDWPGHGESGRLQRLEARNQFSLPMQMRFAAKLSLRKKPIAMETSIVKVKLKPVTDIQKIPQQEGKEEKSRPRRRGVRSHWHLFFLFQQRSGVPCGHLGEMKTTERSKAQRA